MLKCAKDKNITLTINTDCGRSWRYEVIRFEIIYTSDKHTLSIFSKNSLNFKLIFHKAHDFIPQRRPRVTAVSKHWFTDFELHASVFQDLIAAAAGLSKEDDHRSVDFLVTKSCTSLLARLAGSLVESESHKKGNVLFVMHAEHLYYSRLMWSMAAFHLDNGDRTTTHQSAMCICDCFGLDRHFSVTLR